MSEIAEVQKPPIIVLRERLEGRRIELKNALPSDVTVDEFIRAVTTSAQLNPDIQACTWQSVWNACLRACRDGLLPDGVDGALVPYKDKAAWIPMYQGLLRRFRRSGRFKAVHADCVREGDRFTYHIDETGPHLFHEPSGNFEAAIVKIYALANTTDGGIFVAVLPIAEANKIRKHSQARRDDSPWALWPEEMYKKTALRRLCKTLPSGRDIVPDDDDEPAELPSPAPSIAPRALGSAAQLDQFAGPVTVPAGSADGGAQVAADAAGRDPAADRQPESERGEKNAQQP